MVTAVSTKQAVGYVRVSTAEQAGERHNSLETQAARVKAYCDTNGLAQVGLFTDVQSGRRDNRPEYRRMLDLVVAGGAEVVVVQFLDRFGRNPREMLTRYWQLEEQGIQVVATDEDIREELMLLMRAGLAGAESRRTSERVRAYMRTAAQKGVHIGRAPYGFTSTRIIDDKGNRVIWQQEPTEAETVRAMYRMAVEENLGYYAIADTLTRHGYPTRKGQSWAAYTVQRVLTNEAIAGVLVYGRKPKRGNPAVELVRVPEFFPPILTATEWGRLQERLSIRRESARGGTHKSDYLLSGIARCGLCGGPLVGKVGGLRKRRDAAPGERYRNYWCGRAMQARGSCVSNGHSAPRLEAAVLEYLGQYSDPDKVRELMAAKEASESERLPSDLALVERRLAELEADFHENLALLKRGTLDEGDFLRANAVRKQERTTLENRRAELANQAAQAAASDQAAAAVPARVQSFLDDFQGMETRKAKAVLQTILKAVHVYQDKRLELEFRGS